MFAQTKFPPEDGTEVLAFIPADISFRIHVGFPLGEREIDPVPQQINFQFCRNGKRVFGGSAVIGFLHRVKSEIPRAG